MDWTTGCVGPEGIDLARARINLVWDFDQETADAFLAAWRVLEPDVGVHPFWDVLDAVDSGPGVPPEKLPRHETFMARALAELG